MKTYPPLALLFALICLVALGCNLGSQVAPSSGEIPTEAQPAATAITQPTLAHISSTEAPPPAPVQTLPPRPLDTAAPLPSPAVFGDDPNPPSSPVKLIFIHHSTGGMWLADDFGGLGMALMANNYFVSATNYGWGPDNIGDRTDIINWPEWFTWDNRDAYMDALYNESGQNFGDFGAWSRLSDDPGGENQIIVLKSCFPNSDMWGSPVDPPASEINDQNTVVNAKAIYLDLLTYFATRPDKLFIIVTAPPLAEGEYWEGDQTAAERSTNIRSFNTWLMNDWLVGYPYSNVAVFDYYNVLTSNGSDSRTDLTDTNEEPSDVGWEDGNHHRWWNGAVQYLQTVDNNYSAYPSDSYGDSHPTYAGQQKAAEEFVTLLNVFYNRWVSSMGALP